MMSSVGAKDAVGTWNQSHSVAEEAALHSCAVAQMTPDPGPEPGIDF